MNATGFISIILIAINFIVSYKGFKSRYFLDKYKFRVDTVLVQKDYKVLVTSGFLHAGWFHLIFNMMTLYAFSEGLEWYLGGLRFTLIYFVSLVAGGLFSLFIHRNEGDYSAIGASGAVSGLIFASIAIFPGMKLGFFGSEPFIPSWLFGFLFVIISIYGIRAQRDNIGHDAHLAGGLAGMITAIIMQPETIVHNYIPIILVLVPSVVFIYLLIKNPYQLSVATGGNRKKQVHTIDQRYNIEKLNTQKEIDRILEKIHRSGMESLSKKEKDFLTNNR